jgi:hypothetical protein
MHWGVHAQRGGSYIELRLIDTLCAVTALQSLWVPLGMPVPSTTTPALVASRMWATSSPIAQLQGSSHPLVVAARCVALRLTLHSTSTTHNLQLW